MSNQKQDYLFEDPVIPSQQFYCVSFFNKFSVKQSVDNTNDYKQEVFKSTEKEDYSTDNNILGLKIRGGFSNFPDAYKEIATAGLKAPPDILPPKNTPVAKAAPIAKKLLVAKMTKTKSIVPKNSTKYGPIQ